MKNPIKILWCFLGFFFLALGTLGIYLPILPTVPFYLLTSYCFAKGSDRFFRWFSSTKPYKKYLADYVAHRRMTLKRKLSILTLSHSMMLIPLMTVDNGWLRFSMIVLIFCKWYYFFKRIETYRPNKAML